MLRWLLVCAALCAGAYYAVTKLVPTNELASQTPRDQSNTGGAPETTFPNLPIRPLAGAGGSNRVQIINDARITPLNRQDVGSERPGTIVLYGTELKPGEEKSVQPDRLITQPFVYIAVQVDYDPKKPALSYPLSGTPDNVIPYQVPLYVKDPVTLRDISNYFTLDNSEKVYTRWKEGMPLWANHVQLVDEVRKFRKLKEQDKVEKGELLALINPDLAITDLRNKHIKLNAAEADRQASANTRDEAKTRLRVLEEQLARTPGAVSPEELRGAQLNVVRYTQEEIAKRAQVRAAEFDVISAMKVVSLHEVKAAMSGVVKTINKNRGDSVKENQDTLLQIVDPQSLRAEAFAEVQDVRRLRVGQSVQLEVSLRVTPKMSLPGVARREINAVAVSNANGKDKPRVIVAGSEDGTLRCWDAATGQEYWSPVRVPAAVRALACSPRGAENNLLLIGAADGSAHIYDLANPQAPPIALPEMHKGPITAVAFSPDGMTCATAGSDDRAIMLWSLHKPEGSAAAKWERQQVLADAHRAAITSLAFTAMARDSDRPADDTSNWRLISAGRDNALIVWKAEKGKPLVKDPGMEFNRRSGDVTQFSSDGERVLFDSGKELRVLSLRDRRIVGTLRNPTGAGSFSTMALFSPDGATVLTTGPEGYPQLWRSPPKADRVDFLAEGRGSELRQFASTSAATCGSFDPDGAFVVTGTQDGQVLVWEMPKPEEVEKRIPATVVLAEEEEGTFKQARVWAEVKEIPLWYKLSARSLAALRSEGVPDAVLTKLRSIKDHESTRETFLRELAAALGKEDLNRFQSQVMNHADTRPWLVPGSTATIVVAPE